MEAWDKRKIMQTDGRFYSFNSMFLKIETTGSTETLVTTYEAIKGNRP
jgi:hypothetical protein